VIKCIRRQPSVLVIEGLGNQLFQFALGHRLGIESGTNVHLLTPFKPWRLIDRPFALDPLLRICDHVELRRDSRFRLLRGIERLNYLLLIRLGFSLPIFRIRSNILRYPVLTKKYVNRLVATGFYLDFDFSKGELEVVLDELNSHLKTITKPQILPKSYGVLHVRRGDFDSINFGHLSVQYFSESIAALPKVSETILVSDSPDQVSDLAAELNISTIFGPEQLDPLETLAVMSSADFVVGSNSTFSWWGAALCCFNGGISILPNKWFKNRESSMFAAPKSNMLLVEPKWVE